MTATEIEVPRRLLIGAVSLVLLAIFTIVGLAVSPRGADGPLVLTPERRAVLRFLRAADGWAGEMDLILGDLDAIARSTGDIYNRSQQAIRLRERAGSLAGRIDAFKAPAAMMAVHSLAREAASATLRYADAVNGHVGVPRSDIEQLSEQTHETVEQFRETLHAASGLP
jgi:hypothetical protein